MILLCLYDLGCWAGELVTTRILHAIWKSLQSGQEWLFLNRAPGYLSSKAVLRTVDRLAEVAGILEVSHRQKLSRKKVTPHTLRHSHVVNALMAGVPVTMIHRSMPLSRRRW